MSCIDGSCFEVSVTILSFNVEICESFAEEVEVEVQCYGKVYVDKAPL